MRNDGQTAGVAISKARNSRLSIGTDFGVSDKAIAPIGQDKDDVIGHVANVGRVSHVALGRLFSDADYILSACAAADSVHVNVHDSVICGFETKQAGGAAVHLVLERIARGEKGAVEFVFADRRRANAVGSDAEHQHRADSSSS